MLIMYEVRVESATSIHAPFATLGSSSALVKIQEFPSHFPYLIEYMRMALSFSELRVGEKYKMRFERLSWSQEEDISLIVRQQINEAINRQHAWEMLHGS